MKVFGSCLCTTRATETQNYRIPTSAITRTWNLLLVFGSSIAGEGVFVRRERRRHDTSGWYLRFITNEEERSEKVSLFGRPSLVDLHDFASPHDVYGIRLRREVTN